METKEIISLVSALAAVVSAVAAVCTLLWGTGIVKSSKKDGGNSKKNASAVIVGIVIGIIAITISVFSVLFTLKLYKETDNANSPSDASLVSTQNDSDSKNPNNSNSDNEDNSSSNDTSTELAYFTPESDTEGEANTKLQEEQTHQESYCAPDSFPPGDKVIEDDVWIPHNCDNFGIQICKKAGEVLFKANSNMDEPINTDIAVLPKEKVDVSIFLIDYETGTIIQKKIGFIGDDFTFTDIPEGKYYYSVQCPEYNVVLYEGPLVFYRNPFEEESIINWYECIEAPNQSYSAYFTVCILDSKGTPIENTEFYYITTDESTMTEGSYCVSAMTNAEGYITEWWGINDVDYYLIDNFSLADGYVLKFCQIGDSDEQGVIVAPSGSDCISVTYPGSGT